MPPDKIDLTWRPMLSLLEKELRRFWSVSTQTLLIPLVNTSLYLMIFGMSLGKGITLPNQIPYLAFLIPGLVMMGVLNNAFQNSSASISTSRFHGDLEDLRIVPLNAIQITTAFAVGGMVRGILVGMVTFAAGEVFYLYSGNGWLGVAHPIAVTFFLLLGGLAFACLGVVIAFWAKTIDQLSLIGGFVLLPLLYLGGVFFPLERLSPFWQQVSRINPILYLINGVRFGILGTTDVPVLEAVLVSTLTLVVLTLMAFQTVRKSAYGRW